MNEQERAELERLKQRQLHLTDQLKVLGRELEALENRIARSESAPPPANAPSVVRLPKLTAVPIAAPPIISPAVPPPQPATPPPVQPPPKPHALPVVTAIVAAATAPKPLAEPVRLSPPPTAAEPSKIPPAKPASFEMRLGTYWLVRIGIVLLLTGLVFFGAYAYQNFIDKLGPGGKVGLLYLASAILLGFGAWLQKKSEALKNYGQVLLAGGLAAVYFTTYAAHHIPTLRVIGSSLLDGALLLGWAGFIIWTADRRKSEVMALFAVLLAYYSSIITNVGLFTLYSNLVLTAAAVFFLVRNRWATLSFASLVATYVGYAFWRFYQDGEWRLAGPNDGLWRGNFFLIAYWTLFTAAVFLSKHEQFAGSKRFSFVTLNNGAFFAAFIVTMLQVRQGGFWKFSLTYGTVLLALALLARMVHETDRLVRNAYLTQGLLLVTLGFITYFSGLKLSLVLAVESFVLVTVARQMRSFVLQVASVIAAFLSVGWGLTTFATEAFNNNQLIMGATVGALMLLNAFWLRKETTFEQGFSHLRTVVFTGLALAMWFATTWMNSDPNRRGLDLAIEAAVFLIAAPFLRNRPLQAGAWVFAILATGVELAALNDQFAIADRELRTGVAPGILVGVLLAGCAVWEQRATASTKRTEYLPAVTLHSVLCLVTWLATTWVFTPGHCLAPTLAIEALLFTASYYALRLKQLSLGGQVYLLIAQCLWLYDALALGVQRPWWNPAVVIFVTLALAHWWQRQKTVLTKQPVGLVVQGICALAIVGLLHFWLQPHFTASGWLAFTSLLAILLTAYGALNRLWLLSAAGQLFVLVSIWNFGTQLLDGKPEWHFALAPLATMCLLSFSALKWFEHRPDAKAEIRQPILALALAYRVIAMAMALWWVQKYIPARENCWVYALLGVALFALAGWRRNRELLVFSAVFTLAGIARFCLPLEGAPSVYVPNLLAILVLLGQQQAAQRLPRNFTLPEQTSAVVITLGGLALWLFVSRWILQGWSGFYLTAGWSCLALVLFVTGMTLRERVYRWLGLGILACALCRVVIFDVWRLETIYRVLSLMALGVVLLVLGFLYNKYQEKIRQWL